MQRFDADGAKIGTEVRILFDRPLQESLGQGILRDGSAIVAYRASQYMNTVDFVRRDSLLIQRYGVDGAPIGAPTEVTFDEYHGFGNPGYTAYEAAWVLAWDDGSFLVAWRELDVTNRSDLGTSHFVSQRYAAAGQAVGTPRTIAFSALGYGVVTVAFTEMDATAVTSRSRPSSTRASRHTGSCLLTAPTARAPFLRHGLVCRNSRGCCRWPRKVICCAPERRARSPRSSMTRARWWRSRRCTPATSMCWPTAALSRCGADPPPRASRTCWSSATTGLAPPSGRRRRGSRRRVAASRAAHER